VSTASLEPVASPGPDRSQEPARCILEGELTGSCGSGLPMPSRRPPVQWHVAQMLGGIPRDSRQRSRAARILRCHLDTPSDRLVPNRRLATMAALARADPGLVEPLAGCLRRPESSSPTSVSSQAPKLLAELCP
jgi:hypothetical protein